MNFGLLSVQYTMLVYLYLTFKFYFEMKATRCTSEMFIKKFTRYFSSFYTARSAGQKGCVNMLLLGFGWRRLLMDQSERSR
jgi:hypothetical protein